MRHGKSFLFAVLVAIEVGGGVLAQCPITKVAPDDGDYLAEFGTSVALSGRTMFVGAPRAASHGASSGTVYRLEQEGLHWFEAAQVFPADPEARHSFGQVLAVDDQTLAVLAPGDDDAGHNAGAVYVFSRPDLAQVAKLYPIGSGFLGRHVYGASLAVEKVTVT